MNNKPQDFVSFLRTLPGWLLQADTLAYLALMLGVMAWANFAFAERWAKDGAKMTWAPWMQNKTPASYRRMGYANIVCAVISAVGSLVSACVSVLF
jgi:hypothetical protein